MTTLKLYKYKTNKTIETILDQYTISTKALNKLFKVAPDKCYLDEDIFFGFGCCLINKDISESGIIGPAKDLLIHKREEKFLSEYKKDPKNFFHKAPCEYHKKDYGCILEEYKSPLCLSCYCNGEIKEKFNGSLIYKNLNLILIGGFDQESQKYNPDSNWNIVSKIVNYSNQLTLEVLNKIKN